MALVSMEHVDGTVRGVLTAEKILDTPKELGPKEKFLSKNHKVGLSINFPHFRTCCPTKICNSFCYGAIRGAHITYDRSLLKYLRNYHSVINNPPEVIGEKIAAEFHKQKNFDFIRWNGVGDLFPEAVKVINYLIDNHPDIKLWIVTRKPEMAVQIKSSPNIYIMFSLDKSSLDRQDKVNKLGGHSRLYFSYLKVDNNDQNMPQDISIVFNAKQLRNLDETNVGFYCPVDNRKNKSKNACMSCRKCFSESVIK